MNPAEFIPLAEKEGMIEQITDYVIDNVFRDLGDYLATHADRYVSINLSASDFHTSRLIARINQKTEQCAVRPQQIKFEVIHLFYAKLLIDMGRNEEAIIQLKLGKDRGEKDSLQLLNDLAGSKQTHQP